MEGELKVTAANPFTTRLRNETAKAHELLEELPLSQALISEELTTEQYLHYLSIMHSIVLATERDLYPRVEKFFPDIQKRVKIHLINADLETLNNKFTLPEFNFEPVSDEEAVGMLYVMEGSVLGGRYILTNVQQNLNLSADRGAAYFAGYGNQTGMMWKKFLNAFTKYAETANHDAIITGANKAFISIREKLTAG